MAEIGDVINSRWELIEKLGGESGQGYAFKVKDLKNPNNKVKDVIKILKKINEKTLNRFRKEIEASIKLNHPNIVNVVDYQYENTEIPYLVIELCSGGELKKEKVEKLSFFEKLKICESICEAISFAHENKVIHRDIKPSNIFFDNQKDKNPIIGDFGLCFFNTDETDERLTETLEQVGAKSFRPPEAEYGIIDEMEPSFDIYSLGKLLYWFLSNGRHVIRENVTHPNFDLRKNNEEQVIHFVYKIFEKSIREEPSERYKDATEMFEDIRKLIELVESDARYLDCNIPQKCIFCRIGDYEFTQVPKFTDGNTDYLVAINYGLNFVDYRGTSFNNRNKSELPEYTKRFLIAHCDHCGNIQHFHIGNLSKIEKDWKNIPEA